MECLRSPHRRSTGGGAISRACNQYSKTGGNVYHQIGKTIPVAEKSAKYMRKWRYIMSAIQELAPYISAYQGNIKRAKEDQHYTIDRLVDESGVSRSAVSKLCAGTQQDPKLYNSAALCRVLGLSLDELFGLKQPTDSPSELQERNHRLELENVRATSANEMQRAQIKATHAICYLLVFFCAMLTFSLIVYLVIDSQITDAGIIRDGRLSVMAWIFIALIVASILAVGFTILRIVKKETRNEKTESPRG
jgi:transcriptional regulator with XRE-family HTH domain